MTARRDNEDDPVLASMRTVWLSMRDEEPPTSGLAELLAAARAKAEAMQPNLPWWRRALVMLQRPPVLALATSVLLIGGAVMIGVREDGGDRAPERVQQPPPAPIEARNEVMKDKAERATSDEAPAARPDPTTIEPPPPEPVRSPELEDRSPPRRAVVQAPRPPPPKVRPAPPQVAREKGADPVAVAATPPPAPPAVPSAPSAPPREDAVKEAGGLVIAQDELPVGGSAVFDTASRAPDQAPAGEVIEAPGRAPIRSSADGDGKLTNRARPARGGVEQLARQSITAATKGDCPAVRAIVTRMQKMDKTFSKDHVSSNAAVAKCVK